MIRLLIADNNAELCNILNRFFERHKDIDVVGIAHDGERALDLIQEKEPDVVILDISMPVLDGIAVMQRIPGLGLSHRPHVIVLTAFGREDLMTKMLQLGVDYYIIKPFDLDVLTERIRQFAETGTPLFEENRGGQSITAVTDDLGVTALDSGDPAGAVTEIMHRMGVPAHFRGYVYLRDALLLLLEEEVSSGRNLNKVLYPRIAAKYGTSPGAVEGAIRNAIITAWRKGNKQYISKLIGQSPTSGKSGIPSNALILAKLVDRLRVFLHLG